MKPDYSKHMPAKRMGAGVLFLNDKSELLLVKPSYKAHWSIPGGIVDDHESPRHAAIREVEEEIGLIVEEVDFLGVNYVGDADDRPENLQFIFYGGVLEQSQIKGIKIDNHEIIDFKFLPIKEAVSLLNKNLQIRIPKCVEAIGKKMGIYFEI